MKSFIYSASHFKECVYFPLSVLDLRSMVQGSSSICGSGVYLVRCSLWKLLYQVVIYQALAQFWYFHNKILQIHLLKRPWSDLPNLFESDTFQVTFGWLFFFVLFSLRKKKKTKKKQAAWHPQFDVQNRSGVKGACVWLHRLSVLLY